MARSRSREGVGTPDPGDGIEIATGPAGADGPYTLLVPQARKATIAATTTALWAFPVVPRLPPHARLEMLLETALDGVVLPTARLAAHGADWIICREPRGPALAQQPDGAFDEASLISDVLRPACADLEALRRLGLTHRAIRPSNVFRAKSDRQVELGPFWFAPPAHGQPAIAETPWIAACLPEARGAGSIADDVYALGVLLLELCLGEVPLAGVSADEVIDRKIKLGSYAALVGARRLSPSLADLLSAMLSDEPSQRPLPARLAEGATLAGPKVISRRRVNAAVPLMLGSASIWTTPQLARAIVTTPDLVRRALLLGQVNHWLRRCLNEVVLAEKLEGLVRPSQQLAPLDSEDPDEIAAALLEIARLLDPASPLIWRGICMMPDGIGPVLASFDDRPDSERSVLRSALSNGLAVVAATAEREEDKRLVGARGRLVRSALRSPLSTLYAAYELNPALACRSPQVAGAPPAMLAELLPALETEIAARARGGATVPESFSLDKHLVAFVAARRRPSRPPPSGSVGGIEQLRLLAAVWQETRPGPVPSVARTLAGEALAAASALPGRAHRDGRTAALLQAAETGNLVHLLATVEDGGAARAAFKQLDAARERIRHLRGRRDVLRGAGLARRNAAKRFGRDGLASIGTALAPVVLLLQLIP